MIKKLERAIIFFLFLYVIFAPHSICLSEIAVILGLVFWGLKVISVRKLEGRWVWTRGNLERPILSFFAIAVFSLLTAYDRFKALGQIKSLWLFLFYFLIINNVTERKDIIRLITLLVISATVASIHGLYQYFFMHTIAVQAFIKNVITLAGFFLLVIPLSFGLFLGHRGQQKLGLAAKNRDWLRRCLSQIFCGGNWLYLIMSLLLLLALIFTLERSVWLGLMMAILTFFFVGRRSLTALTIGVIILGLLFSFSPTLRQRARTLSHFRNYAISSRFHQWQAGLTMMLDHPLTGVGPGNYDTIYKQYKFFEERKTYPHAHSNIVQIGAETGVLGLSIFFWMMVSAFMGIWHKVCSSRQSHPVDTPTNPLVFSLSLGALAAFLGFHFAGLFEYNFGDSEVQLLFWFIIGSIEKI